jgi:hypothetical protein
MGGVGCGVGEGHVSVDEEVACLEISGDRDASDRERVGGVWT